MTISFLEEIIVELEKARKFDEIYHQIRMANAEKSTLS
jgi:hypothetical protein